jgi:arylsulfatase A-like enzyme
MSPITVTVVAFLALICSESLAAAKPNILVIVADDLGYADVLFNPQHPKEVSTPHLDALAKSGVVCRQGYVSGHVCSPARNLFWCSGSDEGWWAVRSGDWKLVAQRAQVELFNLAQDVSEKTDLAKTPPDKLAALTKLHDDWLAQMAKPVKAGEKKWTLGMGTAKKKKLAPEQKQKARDEERAKKRAENQ